jgi:hypothetical protein
LIGVKDDVSSSEGGNNCNQPNSSKFLTDELLMNEMNDDDDVVENWK